MLTSDLARAQVRSGKLFPRWIDPDKDSLRDDAQALITHFGEHIGRSAGELDEVVADLAALRTDVILIRGLAKLLWDRSTTGTPEMVAADGQVISPSALRQAVFRAAGASWPVRVGGDAGFTDRAAVIARVADDLKLSAAVIEAGLYGDLADEQRLLTFEPLTPEALLTSYNMALAQACLLKAREVRIELGPLDPKRLRALFRELKFRRLLFRAESSGDGVKLVLDGPLSLFKQTSRYGLQLALLLPALTRVETWSLEADLAWAKGANRAPERVVGRPVTLCLDQKSPLTATGRDVGVWTSAEEDHFVKAFAALESPWKLEAFGEVVDLDGRDVLIPDYVVRHPDGRAALVELVFAWRKKTFEKRMQLLADVGPKHLVIALADKGGADDDGLPEGLMAYRFKGIIAPKRIIELAEKVARVAPLPKTRKVAEPKPKSKSTSRAASKAQPKADGSPPAAGPKLTKQRTRR